MESPAEGLVVRVDARQCEVLAGGEVRPAMLRGRLFEAMGDDRSPVAVGDRVRLGSEGDDLSIDEVLPRRNLFSRRAAGDDPDRRQLLAANVDQVVVVNSVSRPPFSSIAADRILVACSFAGIPAALVLNKTDESKPRKLQRLCDSYARCGAPVLCTSAVDGNGLDAFRELLHDRTSVLYGLSGVGKSTLLNAIDPELRLETREVSGSLHAGRHTTTFSRWYPLLDGGAVIDTPGVRKFRPYGLPPHELRLHYPEFRAYDADCHYTDCSHRDEPGCAARAALESGEIPRSRYRSYLELLDELQDAYGQLG